MFKFEPMHVLPLEMSIFLESCLINLFSDPKNHAQQNGFSTGNKDIQPKNMPEVYKPLSKWEKNVLLDLVYDWTFQT